MTVDLSFRRLEAFVTVATLGNYTDAAEQLFVSQSAVSRRVQDLEKELGSRLLDRGSRSAVLTAEGQEFLSIALAILEARKQGLERFRRYQQGLVGTLTIATIPSIAATLLPSLVRTFVTEHPGVAIRIADGADWAMMELVRNEGADLAVAAVLPNSTLQDDLNIAPLLSDALSAVFRSDHPWSLRESVTWQDLSTQPLISLTNESGVRTLTDNGFALAGTRVEDIVEASSISTIAGLIIADLGIAALPGLVFNLISTDGLVHRPLEEPALKRTIAVFTSKARKLSPIARSFQTLLLRKEGEPPEGSEWAQPTGRYSYQ
jgi:LysR family carnitine catabolism transcriptional activator